MLFKYTSSFVFPNGCRSTFTKVENITIRMLEHTLVDFTFLGAKDVLLNNEPLNDATKVAFNLSQSVYPLIFQRDDNGLKLLNFKMVKHRWEKYCKSTCKYEMSEYVKKYIKSSAETMKGLSTFLEAIMQGCFIQLILFKEKQESLMTSNFPTYDTLISWQCQENMVESIPQVFFLKAHPLKSLPYFVEGKGVLEITRTQLGIPKEIHLELRVEMANEGHYSKMVDINLIDEK